MFKILKGYAIFTTRTTDTGDNEEIKNLEVELQTIKIKLETFNATIRSTLGTHFTAHAEFVKTETQNREKSQTELKGRISFIYCSTHALIDTICWGGKAY